MDTELVAKKPGIHRERNWKPFKRSWESLEQSWKPDVGAPVGIMENRETTARDVAPQRRSKGAQSERLARFREIDCAGDMFLMRADYRKT